MVDRLPMTCAPAAEFLQFRNGPGWAGYSRCDLIDLLLIASHCEKLQNKIR
jgi:hypothetical protein